MAWRTTACGCQACFVSHFYSSVGFDAVRLARSLLDGRDLGRSRLMFQAVAPRVGRRLGLLQLVGVRQGDALSSVVVIACDRMR